VERPPLRKAGKVGREGERLGKVNQELRLRIWKGVPSLKLLGLLGLGIGFQEFLALIGKEGGGWPFPMGLGRGDQGFN